MNRGMHMNPNTKDLRNRIIRNLDLLSENKLRIVYQFVLHIIK